MKKFLIAVFVCLSFTIHAQPVQLKPSYSAEIMAGAGSYGLSGRYYADKKTAAEARLSVNPDQKKFLLSGFYEQFYNLKCITGLQWYAGLGLHGGYIKSKTVTISNTGNVTKISLSPVENKEVSLTPVGGADIILGLHYPVMNTPVIIGASVNPYMDFVNSGSQLFNYSIRIGYKF